MKKSPSTKKLSPQPPGLWDFPSSIFDDRGGYPYSGDLFLIGLSLRKNPCTLWKANMTIEHGPFIVDLPIKNGHFPKKDMLAYERVFHSSITSGLSESSVPFILIAVSLFFGIITFLDRLDRPNYLLDMYI